ncbi:MAG: helix-turn-helix transcriptional regulator [Steroidobacteraceae bacterium]|jgi:DNA-binding CsgD family transcriptional regulator
MLSRRDLTRVLSFVEGAQALPDLDGLALYISNQLPKLIQCDAASYNEINPRLKRIRWVVTDGVASFPDAERVFEAHMPEHPFVNHHARCRGQTAVKISDFLSQRRWRSTGMYSEFYCRLGLEHVLAIYIPTQPGFVGISPLRAGAEFSERERAILTLLRPHLVHAYRTAALRTEYEAELGLFLQGMDVAGFGAILLGRDDRISALTGRARSWLARYFDAAHTEGAALPSALQAVLDRTGPINATANVATTPPVALRGGKYLRAHWLSHRGRRLMVLQEERGAPSMQDLAPLGLARRETETLKWVAYGKTDAEIARILSISTRTVNHTLARVYRKLGVETRLAAALRAARVAEGTL